MTAAPSHRHEALLYASDDEFVTSCARFARTREPLIVVVSDAHAAALRRALPTAAPVTFLSPALVYERPAQAIRSYRDMFARHVAGGAGTIRLLGEPGPAVLGAAWDWWARYESAVNYAYDEFPLRHLCAYDVRTTPAGVLTDVARTHPWLTLPTGDPAPSRDYTEPTAYLSENRPLSPDPLQRAAPRAELADPTPAQARQAVRDADPGLGVEVIDDLVVAVSEAVTNALRHGRPPVRLRVWTAPTRLVVTVTDAGPGPKDPFAGLLPAAERATGGRGLWITHQACSHVSFARDREGWTIRLVAGQE